MAAPFLAVSKKLQLWGCVALSVSTPSFTSRTSHDGTIQQGVLKLLAGIAGKSILCPKSLLKGFPAFYGGHPSLLAKIAEQTVRPSDIHLLPQELFLTMLSYLEPEDIVRCRGVSRPWQEAFGNPGNLITL
jgi:F-box-like